MPKKGGGPGMNTQPQDHETKLFEGLIEAGMESMAFSQTAGRLGGWEGES